MLKNIIITIFKWLGLIVASMAIWSMVIGDFYKYPGIESKELGVYPSYFNKVVYSNSLNIISKRMFSDTDGVGTGYAQRTYDVYIKSYSPTVIVHRDNSYS